MKDKKMKINLLALLIFVLCIGCKDNNTNTNETNNLIPLKIGNKWIYQGVSFDSNGIQKLNPSYDSLEIVGDTTINNEKFYLQQQGKYKAIYPITIRSEGVFIYDIIFKVICMTCKYPGNNGDHFASCIGETIIESNNCNLSIPLGNFRCYKYIVNDNINSYRIYYSPGIGMIKEEWYKVDSKANIYLFQAKTLISYILK